MSKSKVIRFSIRLWGEQLLPNLISETIGMQPSSSYEKGFRKKLSSGKLSAPKDLGIWVADYTVNDSFEKELSVFLEKFDGLNLKSIEGVQMVTLDLYLGLSDSDSILDESYECILDKDTLLRLQKLGVDVRITVS